MSVEDEEEEKEEDDVSGTCLFFHLLELREDVRDGNFMRRVTVRGEGVCVCFCFED